MQAVRLADTKKMDRAEWIDLRRKSVGGSDIAKIVGLSKWGNAISVYLEKINPVIDNSQSEAAEIGTDLEEYVAKKFSQRTEHKVRRVNAVLQHPLYPWATANIDRLVLTDPQAVLECKLSGTKKDWSPDGEEVVVPQEYYLQVQWYLLVTGLKKAWIAALLGGFGGHQILIREIERDEEVIQHLKAAGEAFWQCVVNRTPPALDENGCIQGLVFHSDPPNVILPEMLLPRIQRFRELGTQLKPLEKERDAIKDELNQIMALADDDCESFACGPITVIRKRVIVNRLDSKALQEEEPETYAAYLKESVQRRLSIKGG